MKFLFIFYIYVLGWTLGNKSIWRCISSLLPFLFLVLIFVHMKGLAALIIVNIGSANKLVKTKVTRTTQNDM